MFSLLLFFTHLVRFVCVSFKLVHLFTSFSLPTCPLFNILVVILKSGSSTARWMWEMQLVPFCPGHIFHSPNVQLGVSQKQILQLSRTYAVSCRFKIFFSSHSLLVFITIQLHLIQYVFCYSTYHASLP